MKLAFSRDARGDFVRLRAFIAQHDPTAAERAARGLIQGIERLVRHPGSGSVLDIAPTRSRRGDSDWLVGDYVTDYLIVNDQIIVLRLWHGKENRP